MKKTYKIETFIPEESFDKMIKVLHDNDFGKIGNYVDCLNWYKINSSWTAIGEANPYRGELNKTEFATEYKIEFRCEKKDLKRAIALIRNNHPYEEVCINIVPMFIG